jgi:hypothetical protein
LIFVSHSCKDALVNNPPPATDPVKLARLRFALAVRSALVARLDPGGAADGSGRVWFDRKRLQAGDDWELDIVGALHTCEAAVLLLTPDALESPWVLREATVLGDRRSRWPDLRLVPVLFAGTTHESTSKNPWWAALDITRWQPVQAPHGAFEGDEADGDLIAIVDQVAERLAKLNEPRDAALERWAEEVRAFLGRLAARQLKTRLDDAATELHLKPPVRWDHQELDWLARALLQADIAEVDNTGAVAYPLLLALDRLVPDDPRVRSREPEEEALCARLEPLAAPPSASVAVGLARVAASGDGPAPVMLCAQEPLLAQLSVRRATCDDARIVPLTEVDAEATVVPAAAKALAERAARLRKPVYFVTTLHLTDEDDLDSMAQNLAAKLPRGAGLVAVIGRDSSAPAAHRDGTIVVAVPAADEEAALIVSQDLEYLAGRK